MSGRVGVQDHHDVAVDAVDPLGTQPVGGVLDREGAPRSRSDHQDILRPDFGAGAEGRAKTVHFHSVQVVSQVVGIAGRRTHDHQDGGKSDQHPPACTSTPPVSSRSTSTILSARLGTIDLLAERDQAGKIGSLLRLEALGPFGSLGRLRRRHLGFEAP